MHKINALTELLNDIDVHNMERVKQISSLATRLSNAAFEGDVSRAQAAYIADSLKCQINILTEGLGCEADTGEGDVVPIFEDPITCYTLIGFAVVKEDIEVDGLVPTVDGCYVVSAQVKFSGNDHTEEKRLLIKA